MHVNLYPVGPDDGLIFVQLGSKWLITCIKVASILIVLQTLCGCKIVTASPASDLRRRNLTDRLGLRVAACLVGLRFGPQEGLEGLHHLILQHRLSGSDFRAAAKQFNPFHHPLQTHVVQKATRAV